MGRGKIEIKKIENPTNRQVTYSKRRNGIFKKAQELTVLCDAKVSIVMVSNTGKVHEYTSPNTTIKKMYDQYQKTLNTDIWSTYHDKMLDQLRKLKDINNRLRREIGQRMGEELQDLNFQQLVHLDQKITESLAIVRDRKYHVLKNQTNTYNKKVNSMVEAHGRLSLNFEAVCEDPQYGIVESEGDYETAVTFENGASNLYAFRLHMGQPNNLHHGGGGGSYGFGDLRLA